MVICLQLCADCLHMVQLMPLHPKTQSSLASFKSRLLLPFWYRLTQFVLETRPLNGCSSSSVVLIVVVLIIANESAAFGGMLPLQHRNDELVVCSVSLLILMCYD